MVVEALAEHVLQRAPIRNINLGHIAYDFFHSRTLPSPAEGSPAKSLDSGDCVSRRSRIRQSHLPIRPFLLFSAGLFLRNDRGRWNRTSCRRWNQAEPGVMSLTREPIPGSFLRLLINRGTTDKVIGPIRDEYRRPILASKRNLVVEARIL